jgi:hypothetical protein
MMLSWQWFRASLFLEKEEGSEHMIATKKLRPAIGTWAELQLPWPNEKPGREELLMAKPNEQQEMVHRACQVLLQSRVEKNLERSPPPAHRVQPTTSRPSPGLNSPTAAQEQKTRGGGGRNPDPVRHVVGVGRRLRRGRAGGDPRRLRLLLPLLQAQGKTRSAAPTLLFPPPNPRFCRDWASRPV